MALSVNQLSGFGGGIPEKSISYLQDSFDSVNRTTYTFASVNLGIADPKRVIVIGFASSVSQPDEDILSVTIGGVTATIVASVLDSGGKNARSFIAYAAVPSGTTGNVVVAFTGTALFCHMFTYRVVAQNFGVFATATDIATTLSQSVSLASGGSIIAVQSETDGGATAVWTGATEMADNNGDSSALLVSSSTSPVTITCVVTGSSGVYCMSIISISYE